MRRFLILIHLLVAAFVAPAFLLVALSGGLYLVGNKGELSSTELAAPSTVMLDFKSPLLEEEVRALLEELEIEHNFEYLRVSDISAQTRPTSRTYLQFDQNEQGLKITKQEPNLQKSMIELHKGHGPTVFKTYQKFVAVALLLSVLSGVWMGLASPGFRRKTITAASLGLLVFLILALA
jgi:uncharacterized iron-regulated membrane protein